MNLLIPLKKVREELSELISRVAYGNDDVIITKNGKPVAALVDYDDYEKIKNPTKRFTPEEWNRGFVVMDKVRENAKKYTEKDVEQAVEEAIKEVRKAKRAKSST